VLRCAWYTCLCDDSPINEDELKILSQMNAFAPHCRNQNRLK
jgi:hypothetical protein